MLFLGIPWTYPDVQYVVRKAISKAIQRNWNRGKRFSGGEVIRRTSLMNRNHRGGMISGGPNRPSGGPDGDVRALATFPGTLGKGGLSIILEFSGIVQENPGHDKPPSHFVYNSPSTIWNLLKLRTYENLPSSRI